MNLVCMACHNHGTLQAAISMGLQVPPPDGKTTYKQRYYVCDKHWRKQATSGTDKGPIFFYVGNEADVTL